MGDRLFARPLPTQNNGERDKTPIYVNNSSWIRTHEPVVRATEVHNRTACYLLHAGYLLSLHFDPKDGCDIFLRNVR
jgi:hypothetical protein